MNKNAVIWEDVDTVLDSIDISELQGKTILITGASGLVGTYLTYSIANFVKRGNEVNKLYLVVLNDLPDYFTELEDQEWIEVIRGDLSDVDFCKSLPNADYIIHAAGYGQPAKFVIDQTKTIKLNTLATFYLLDKLNMEGKFLFISSSGIYNGLEKEKFLETDVGTTNTLHPRACYIEGKRCGETICNAYRQNGVNAKSVRLSYTYGPGVRKGDDRALYAFIRKGLSGEISLLDDGSAQRIYCYISDVTQILWNVLLRGEEGLYNVGGEKSVTILELAQIIAKNLECNVILPDCTLSVAGNAAIERLDISKIKREFLKESFIPIEQGVQKTIAWINEQSK